MKRTLSWVALAGLCLAACGGTSHDNDADPSGAAGDGGSSGSAGSGGSNAGTAGRTAQAGEAGSDDSGALPAGAGGQGGSGEAGAGGSSDAGAGGSGGEAGAAGAGGEGSCNEVELIPGPAPCTTFTAAPAATGGDIVDGVYQLISWESAVCLSGLEQTISITQTAPATFELEAVATLGGLTRANAVSVTNGTTFTNTPTCGYDEPDEVWEYSAYQEETTDYLRLSNGVSVFTYERVGD